MRRETLNSTVTQPRHAPPTHPSPSPSHPGDAAPLSLTRKRSSITSLGHDGLSRAILGIFRPSFLKTK
ncbi:hypothetical protein E2C01_063472 [Portunus trituberculatus]|uniref:Uncharacterized protein n=1 Tax=Portunus trituberculatus TaxID=210409 RepID=A0A5B7HI86_PORTR|nr:hypothetical protein [Portunus trituberculatus]